MGDRQHINPQLHLQHFVGNNPPGHVWTYDKTTGLVRHGIPANTAVESHYYSFEMKDGSLNTGLDDMLSIAESDAAPIYQELLNGKFPTDQRKADFATFLALQYLRTPTIRRMAGEQYSNILQLQSYATAVNEKAFASYKRKFTRDTGHVFSEEEWELGRQAMLNPSDYEFSVPKHVTLRAFLLLDKLQVTFFDLNWVLLEAEHGYFITCDNPVFLRTDRRTWHPIYGDDGIDNKTAELSYPLSPTLLLVMIRREVPSGKFPAPLSIVQETNHALAANAERYLYAHIEDKRVSRLARKFKDIRPGIQISGFGPKHYAKTVVPRRWKDRS